MPITRNNADHDDQDNFCSRTLLTIVARGSAIITELNRLIELVPAPFKYYDDDDNNQNRSNNVIQHLDGAKQFTLDNLICDFSYFKEAETFEAYIEANGILKKADEDLCDGFIDIITRFYLTFESIQRYATDLNNFITDLEEDTFVGQTLEGLLIETEYRQQLCEAYFLLGLMLITTDNNFEGGLRERLIVSYYRYSSYKSSPDSSLDETCNLMRGTGFRTMQQQIYKTNTIVQYHRPAHYPESFFARVGVNQSVVNLLIAKLQSIDIYNQTTFSFPRPEHRSVALSQQASILYVILYFCPNILDTQRSRMREMTDKFFYDNWVININMGEIVNLIEAWEPYRAARESLVQLLDLDSIKNLLNQCNLNFHRVSKQLGEYMKEGWLNEGSALEFHAKILNLIREGNVILRWMLLQSQMNSNWSNKLTIMVHNIVIGNQPDRETVFKFLQNLADLERRFTILINKLLSKRDVRILENKMKALETLNELIEIFNDTRPMRWVQVGANTKLASLLANLIPSLQIVNFNQATTNQARDSVINLINQVEHSQESYSDGKNLQVVQLFMATRESLLQILRALSLSDDMKILLHSICDFSYAWRILNETFTCEMHKLIKDDPMKIYGVGSIFLKLASAFDNNLIRIQQLNSQADLISVSQYYSTKLIYYLRNVLHVIPATILELVSLIISIQTEHTMVDMPTKVALDSLKDYALPEVRFKMLELTYKVSHYAESMLKTQDTTIGLIRINSKQLLEDGIRRELVKRMSDSIQKILKFSDGSNELKKHNQANDQSYNAQLAENLLEKLGRLAVVMGGYKNSFEYIQDYLFIYGLRIWREELDRIVKFNVEQALESLTNENYITQAYQSTSASVAAVAVEADNQQQRSIYQSTKAPIPSYSNDPLKSSFMYRILQVLLKITDPRATIYDEQMGAWYDQQANNRNHHHVKVLDLKVFEVLASSLCITGLNGLDQLCCSELMLELQRLDALLVSMATGKSLQSQALMESLASVATISSSWDHQSSSAPSYMNDITGSLIKQSGRIFSTALNKMAPWSEKIANHLLRIGQLQIIRCNISCVLTTKCRYEARNLYNCLETLNTSLLNRLKESSQQPRQRRKQRQPRHTDAMAPRMDPKAATAGRGDNSNSNTSSSNEALNINITTPTPKTSSRSAVLANENDGEDYGDGDDDQSGGRSNHLEDSQLMFDLTNHLEWVGLSDPMSKVYTLALDSTNSSQVYKFRQNLTPIDMMFIILLDHSSKFQFSRSISGMVPKQARSFYESSHNVDGLPLFYGLMTLINHYQPFIEYGNAPTSGLVSDGQSQPSPILEPSRADGQEPKLNELVPLVRLLDRMSIYVKCTLNQITANGSAGGILRPQDLTLELANMILSMVELIRIGRQCHSRCDGLLLPDFILDTFQFTICHLNGAKRS